MPKVQLGVLEEIEIDKVFENERDLSDWLKDNIELLSQKLHLEFDELQREYPIGNFRVDIFGKEINTNTKVIIENQFGKTNHDHLGKILTYASGVDAKIIIWIAEEFTDEHKQALTWLNENTPEEIGFFGIELKVVKIGNSDPAVDFDVVVAPNQWVKISRNPQISERNETYRRFWDELLERYGKNLTPQPQNWMSFSAGKSGIEYSWVFKQGNKFSVELYIGTKDSQRNKQIFEFLKQNKEKIENEIGCSLEWTQAEKSKKGAYRIATYKQMSGNILQIDKNEWNELIEWGCETMKKFENTFSGFLSRCQQ
ncbi:DUF4268 domain-containing protein [Methanocaldococcus fervens]|uniref:DUF4268 domain-containing protein n=1 Tax=Methanocaldococcus fervens (strain DSM 4213 / JCM 15782 / AG86) TaxID=573064 RepID=C7P5E6_METFA|nr:DUF4268 domain-containing protein [Methanocaldococcus fervens]ACV25324.1 conserved hypothetical protein [Methanocaldococcus fervens AG86]